MIAAVVVTYSAPVEMLDRCLSALRAAGGLDRIVVVDTGRRSLAVDDDIVLLEVDNRGYGAAANAGFDRARREGATRIALLNDDVVVQSGWLEPLAAEVRGRIGVAQPVLLASDGTVNSVGVALDRYAAGSDIGRCGPPPAASQRPCPIDLFTGGAVLLATEFLDDTGGFDERYFLYYEDVDLAHRGRALGWSYRLVPASRVEHVGGASTGSDAARTRYLQERNRLWTAWRFGDVPTLVRAFGLSIRRLRRQPRTSHAKALMAGLAGAPGACWRRAVRRNRL